MDPYIRPETESDIEAIFSVTEAAFRDVPVSSHTEEYIIAALRSAGALALSLVAEISGRVVGHIAFSAVAFSEEGRNWYGVGPVSVLPECQRMGVGTRLMREGLTQIQSRGAEGCVLVGHPEFYRRFGFRNLPDLTHEGVPQPFVLALPFGDGKPRGAVRFHDAFRATSF